MSQSLHLPDCRTSQVQFRYPGCRTSQVQFQYPNVVWNGRKVPLIDHFSNSFPSVFSLIWSDDLNQRVEFSSGRASETNYLKVSVNHVSCSTHKLATTVGGSNPISALCVIHVSSCIPNDMLSGNWDFHMPKMYGTMSVLICCVMDWHLIQNVPQPHTLWWTGFPPRMYPNLVPFAGWYKL